MAVMMDSGVRRGTDVLKALALGAQFVFIGRPFLYAAAHRAARRACATPRSCLREEIDRDMAHARRSRHGGDEARAAGAEQRADLT